MMALVLMAVFIGAMLSLRFKIFILVPATFFSFLSTVAIGVTQSDSPWFILLFGIFVVAGLQVGYLGGTIIGFIVVGARARKDLSETIPASQ